MNDEKIKKIKNPYRYIFSEAVLQGYEVKLNSDRISSKIRNSRIGVLNNLLQKLRYVETDRRNQENEYENDYDGNDRDEQDQKQNNKDLVHIPTVRIKDDEYNKGIRDADYEIVGSELKRNYDRIQQTRNLPALANKGLTKK